MKRYQITRKNRNVPIATLPKETTALEAIAYADRLKVSEREDYCVKEVVTIYTTE